MELFPIKYTHSDLIDIAYKWALKNRPIGCAFKDMKSYSSETADVIGFGGSGFSVLIEVKVSRSDFFADRKKPFRIRPENGMGTERYYCCPIGMIKPDELPSGWGLIYVDGKKATLKHKAINPEFLPRQITFTFEKKNKNAELDVMYSALRRLHLKGVTKFIYEK